MAVAQAVLDRGGFTLTARIVFAVLASLAAAAALIGGGGAGVARTARHPLVLVLIALALLGALSSLWTIGFASDSIEWAVLPLAYAALAAAVLAAGDSAPVRAGLLGAIVIAAFISGLVGLVGAATFSDPQAFQPAGAWRPAGTIEYTAGLALLMVCALPALLRALCSGRPAAWTVAAAAVVAGAVLGLSHSRLEVAMGLGVLAWAVAVPERTVRAPRVDAVAAVTLVALAAVGARATVGGSVPLGTGPQAWRVGLVIASCVLAAPAWLALRRLARRSAAGVLALALVALLAAGGIRGFAGSAALSTPHQQVRPTASHRRPPIRNDLLHGRAEIWDAGLEAFGKRPLEGAGAGAFLTATVDLQHGPVTSYAHDLPLELEVELGIPGVLLAIVLYGLVARACWRCRRGRDAWPLAVPALAFLVANLVDWPWHIAGLGAPWAAATAALAAAARPRPRQLPISRLAS